MNGEDRSTQKHDFTKDDMPMFMTMGEFVSLLVDNHDPAVCIRSMKSTEENSEGFFSQTIELILLPDGFIQDEVLKFDEFRMSRLLKEFLVQKKWS